MLTLAFVFSSLAAPEADAPTVAPSEAAGATTAGGGTATGQGTSEPPLAGAPAAGAGGGADPALSGGSGTQSGPADFPEGTAQGAPPNGDALGEPPLGHGVAPGAPIEGGGDGISPNTVSPTSSSSSAGKKTAWDDWAPFVALAGGLVLVAGIGWMWSRPRGSAASNLALPPGVSVLPEAGLFGPGTPSLSNGVFLWIAEGNQSDVVAPLVATLATYHRVLFVAPEGHEVPRVHGGPVFHTTNLDADHVADSAEALSAEGGAPVALVIVNPAATKQELLDYAEVAPAGVGGVVLVDQDADVPLTKLRSSAAGTGWTFRVDAVELTARESANGFAVQPANAV